MFKICQLPFIPYLYVYVGQVSTPRNRLQHHTQLFRFCRFLQNPSIFQQAAGNDNVSVHEDGYKVDNGSTSAQYISILYVTKTWVVIDLKPKKTYSHVAPFAGRVEISDLRCCFSWSKVNFACNIFFVVRFNWFKSHHAHECHGNIRRTHLG